MFVHTLFIVELYITDESLNEFYEKLSGEITHSGGQYGGQQLLSNRIQLDNKLSDFIIKTFFIQI